MIETVIGRKGDSFFTGADAGVPSAEFDVRAAEQVVVFWSRRGVDLLLQGLDGLICVAGG